MDIMWTFAFGEKETADMAKSIFSSGKQAWYLLKQMNDLCDIQHGATLRSPGLVILLASELRAIAGECTERRFAVELRVIRRAGGSLVLEVMDKGTWRKPSFTVNAKARGEKEPG